MVHAWAGRESGNVGACQGVLRIQRNSVTRPRRVRKSRAMMRCGVTNSVADWCQSWRFWCCAAACSAISSGSQVSDQPQ